MPQKNPHDENPNAFKLWINRGLLERMGKSLHSSFPAFDNKKFKSIASELDSLELKPRVQLVRKNLYQLLPADYPKALNIILKSLAGDKLRGFDLWPYTDFIQTYGLDYPKISLEALAIITSKFTGEFAVRPFIKSHTALTMKFLEKCAKNKDVHLRRWASEGTRPRLPWGERLQEFVKDPSPGIKILEILKYDPELYVRKSVANHLNDIAKDNSNVVISILKKWQKSSPKAHQEKINWIIKRALRTLIKDGHPQALALIGVSDKVAVKFSNFKLSGNKFKIDERIEFSFELKSLSKRIENLVVDYIIHYQKSNGSTSKKIFKLKNLQIKPGESVKIEKRHHLKEVTTRKHYSGLHYIEIQVNGKCFAKTPWDLRSSK